MTITNSERALAMLRFAPRLTTGHMDVLTDKCKSTRGKKNRKRVIGAKHNRGRNRWLPLGFEGGSAPFQQSTPIETTYNYGWHAQKQYPPISLKTLQLLIDTGRLDPNKPIDLTALCNTKVYSIDTDSLHMGCNLTSDGADYFATKMNIEVQWADEMSIATIERLGGVITTAYYDVFSIRAMADSRRHFNSGKPIPRRLTPTSDLIGRYTDAKLRGYLADPRQIAEERVRLAQKFGYVLPDLSSATDSMLFKFKDPRQVFYGLKPGMVVDLVDKKVYEATDPELTAYYESEID